MRNKHSLPIIFAAAIVICVMGGCAALVDIAPETPEQAYLKAHMTFNGIVEDYIKEKRAAPPATQAKWAEKIEPWIERGNITLTVWRFALRTGKTGVDQQREFIKIKDQLLQALLEEVGKD